MFISRSKQTFLQEYGLSVHALIRINFRGIRQRTGSFMSEVLKGIKHPYGLLSFGPKIMGWDSTYATNQWTLKC